MGRVCFRGPSYVAKNLMCSPDCCNILREAIGRLLTNCRQHFIINIRLFLYSISTLWSIYRARTVLNVGGATALPRSHSVVDLAASLYTRRLETWMYPIRWWPLLIRISVGVLTRTCIINLPAWRGWIWCNNMTWVFLSLDVSIERCSVSDAILNISSSGQRISVSFIKASIILLLNWAAHPTVRYITWIW